MIRMLAFMAVVAGVVPAQAAATLTPEENSGLCFERDYAPDELRRQPAQRVRRMTARIDRRVSDGKERLSITVSIEMRAGVKPSVVNEFAGVCRSAGAKLVCAPDYEGYRASFVRGKPTTPIELETTGDAVLLRNRGGMAFVSGDVEDYVLPADAAHAAFRLRPTGGC